MGWGLYGTLICVVFEHFLHTTSKIITKTSGSQYNCNTSSQSISISRNIIYYWNYHYIVTILLEAGMLLAALVFPLQVCSYSGWFSMVASCKMIWAGREKGVNLVGSAKKIKRHRHLINCSSPSPVGGICTNSFCNIDEIRYHRHIPTFYEIRPRQSLHSGRVQR